MVLHAIGRTKGQKLPVHNLLFVVFHSNVSFMASQRCDSHVHTFYWYPSCNRCSSMKFMAELFITHGHQHIELNYACAVHHQELPAHLQTPSGNTNK